MIKFLVILCLAAAPAIGIHWSPGWKVRFDVSGFGTTSFIDLPQSTTDAAAKNWTSVTGPTSHAGLEDLTLWCPNTSYVLCAFFDDTDYPAGLQISLDTECLNGTTFNKTTQGFIEWNTEINGVNKTYWSTQQYYVSASGLAEDSATRIANRDDDTLLQEGAIWVSGFNRQLYKISSNYSEFTTQNTNFTKEACIPLMGLHYYYNMTTSTTCEADTLFSWFPIFQSDQLISVGFYDIGTYTTPTDETDWFEKPPTAAVKIIVPTAPQCFYDLSDSPGIFTMHTYFIEYPLLVNCLIQ